MPNFYPLQYYAGLIDGDGYIGMMNINKIPRPTISLGMTHEETVKNFAEFFGVEYKKINSPSMQDNVARGNKQQWMSRSSCHKAYDIIKHIQPWLLEKADIALKCCSYYEGRVCENCGKDIPTDRAASSTFCCKVCYKQAGNKRRSGKYNPIIQTKDIVSPVRKFNDEEEKLSYFGGLIDAEGHFSANTITNGGTRVVFQLKMTSEDVIKEFAEFFNVPYKKLTAPSPIKDQDERVHSQAYVIHTDGSTTYRIIEKLLPFLFTKKKAAEILLKFK